MPCAPAERDPCAGEAERDGGKRIRRRRRLTDRGRTDACRKKKAVHKSSGNDDKKLQSALKRIGVSTIPGIEEVNIFKEEEVVSFSNPKGEVDAQTKRRIKRSKRATE